jgi:hypothetical protein
MFTKILIANRGEIACRVIKPPPARWASRPWPCTPRPTRKRAMWRWPTRPCTSAPRPAARATWWPTRSSPPASSTGAQAVHPGYGFLSENEAFARRVRRRGHHLHRPQALQHRRHGRQDRLQEAGQRGQGQHHPGLERRHRVARAAVEIAKDIGYPVMIKASAGGGGKGLRVAFNDKEALRGLHRLPQRGAQQLRRRPRLHREVRRGAAPHRDPGAGRRARQRGLPERARVLHPAPPPEGDRGGAFALHQRRHAQGHGRAGRGAGQGREVPERRHGGVRGRQGPGLLLPGDEHPAAGGAPGHRVHHRPGPGGADDPRGRRREAAFHAGRREAQRLGHRVPHQRRRPVPQLPASTGRLVRYQPPGRPCGRPPAGAPAAACAWTPASTRAARSRCTTTR